MPCVAASAQLTTGEAQTRHPASGSPRFSHELDIPGLRHWAVQGFPYLVFYRDLELLERLVRQIPQLHPSPTNNPSTDR
jgi:hypothetical protein